ncbi:MAG: hypothetical protein QOF91_3430 [Alphaproteobacteria bacterium]|jgi:hypothetical protein|nr:hypothetical protein [Alphaproteobacteria bacterium]
MKHILRIGYAWACLLSLTAPVHAQSYYGMAGVQCSQYSKAARSSDILYHQASQWLLGYVSGMNAAMRVAKGTTPSASLTSDQVLKSAGDYCEANPASNLANAVNEWYASLPKQTDPQAVQKDPQDNSLTLSLDRAPKIKPLLDRR